jgi:hypothetical protein
MSELYRVGNRPWHYRAFINLLRSAESWEAAQKEYGRINVPVLLIWGDKDWSRPAERERTRSLIPNVEMKTIEGGGRGWRPFPAARSAARVVGADRSVRRGVKGASCASSSLEIICDVIPGREAAHVRRAASPEPMTTEHSKASKRCHESPDLCS